MSDLYPKINVEEERDFNLRSYRPRLKQIGSSIYDIKTHYVSKVITEREKLQQNVTTVLKKKINVEEEKEFHLRSKDFYRPPLKQIGNSIYEIKAHYMSKADFNIIPSESTSNLAGIRGTLLRHLKEDSFLYKKNIVTGSSIEQTADSGQCLPCLVVVMDSLSLALDFPVYQRSSEVQCDILLAICGQPVIVLTLVDGDKYSETVTKYHASVARGVTSSLRRFMADSINIVSGVLPVQDMETTDTFKTWIGKVSQYSELIFTACSLTTSPSKYEKIVTAFWAGVAETKSVISTDGRVDTDYLRFLTKDQCIILMENINNREVEVQFQPGTGATTLMLEVAIRLARLNDTLLVCETNEEKERLRTECPSLKIVAHDECVKISSFSNVVDETGRIVDITNGRLWRFSRVITEREKQQHNVTLLKKKNAFRKKMIYLLYYDDRQRKMEHLSREMETLKLLDINFQELLLAYHLPNEEEQERMRHVLDGLKTGLLQRWDLFPLLQDGIRQDKISIRCLEAKTDFLERVTSGDPLHDDYESQTGTILNKCFASIELKKQFEGGGESTQSSDTEEDDEAWSTDDVEEDEDGGHGTLSPDDEEEADEHTYTTSLDIAEEVDVSCTDEETDESLSLDVPEIEEDDISGTEKGKADEPTSIVSLHMKEDEGQEEEKNLDRDYGKISDFLERGTEEKKKASDSTSIISLPMEADELSETEEKKKANEPTSIVSLHMKEDEEQEEEMKLDRHHETMTQSQSINQDGLPCDVDGARGEDELEAQSLDRRIRERPEAEEFCVEWEETMAYLSHEMSGLRTGEFVTDVIGEDEIPEAPDATSKPFTYYGSDGSTRSGELGQGLIYQMRKMEYGKLKRRDIWDILKNVIKDDHSKLTDLRTQSDRLEREYGSPIHMVGEIGTSHGGPVSCPPMTFNRERVNEELAVSGDGLELVNWRGRSLDHRTDQFKNYWGTSSHLPIPLPPSPSTLTAATYWETHTRLQGKKYVSGFTLLEMAVCGEGQVDTNVLVSGQSRSSWGLIVGYCGKHPGVCTKVWENGRKVGECQTDTMSFTPGTDVTLKYGIALDVGRERLAFIDVNRGRVLHKFDVNFRESLFPMCGVWPGPDDFHVAMRLISGREVAMTGEKQQLIAQALFCK